MNAGDSQVEASKHKTETSSQQTADSSFRKTMQWMRCKLKGLTDKLNNHQALPEGSETNQSAPKLAPLNCAGTHGISRVRSVKFKG